MGRPKAYEPHHFLKVMPADLSQALTKSEISELVGCNHMTANKNVNLLLTDGFIAKGEPTNTGAITYYKLATRPETWMPTALNIKGTRKPLTDHLKIRTVKGPSYLPPVLGFYFQNAVVRLWQAAMEFDDGNDDKNPTFAEVNQQQRAMIIQGLKHIDNYVKMLRSLLDDPFLSGDTSEVAQAQDALRAAWEETDKTETDLADLITYYKTKNTEK